MGGGFEFTTSDSGVDAEGQQFVGVQGVQRAQVRQPQEELREQRAVVRATTGDDGSQCTNQALLELLDRHHISYACPVCETDRDHDIISQGNSRDCISFLHIILYMIVYVCSSMCVCVCLCVSVYVCLGVFVRVRTCR